MVVPSRRSRKRRWRNAPVIAAVFFIEKNVRRGDVLPRVVGAACIAGGLAILAWPVLLTAPMTM